jgi:hypothetical protein
MRYIIFDANFGEPWLNALSGLFSLSGQPEPKPILQHLHTLAGRDVKDDEWIQKLKPLDCIVISADTGRKPRSHSSLPAICAANKKTHIILSSSVHKEKQFQKARAIIVVWLDILEAFNAPLGSRYKLQTLDAEHKHFKLSLKASSD